MKHALLFLSWLSWDIKIITLPILACFLTFLFWARTTESSQILIVAIWLRYGLVALAIVSLLVAIVVFLITPKG